MKTRIHLYRFDTSKQEGRDAWKDFQAARIAEGLEVFATIGGVTDSDSYRRALRDADGQLIDLEDTHLFNNQWNTGPIPPCENGLRVFDWKRDIVPNRTLMTGHYLEQTDEMRAARQNRMACGYCGKQETRDKAGEFCPHCIDSEYLKESDLHLTRMRCVTEGHRYRSPPLNDEESARLVPLYREAQIHGATERGKARIAKARADVTKEFDAATAHAKEKRDAATWILDNVPGLHANWIYYTHTGRHCFGWRTPLDAALTSALLDKISEFPFAYDIKCADGRTLSGD